MAKIIGQIDSLSRLLEIFHDNGIVLFKTVDEIINFNDNYSTIIKNKLQEVKNNFSLEIEDLKKETLSLQNDYNKNINKREADLIEENINIYQMIHVYSQPQKNIFRKLYSKYKIYILNKRKFKLDNDFENEKMKPFISQQEKIEDLNKKIETLNNNYDTISIDRLKISEKKLILAKEIIKDSYSILLGAIGEKKAVIELSKLPDSYFVINNFQLTISPPIFDKGNNSYIKSIQADHIVIGQSGVFLIETKNWSKESVSNNDFYSPVEQMKRTNMALYIYLNNPDNYHYFSLEHDWGLRKVPVRNILLMINNKPAKEFQYVKLLTLKEINSYIKYFKPVFSDTDIQNLYKDLSKNL